MDFLPARHQHLVPTQLHLQQALTLERSQEPAIVFLQSRSQHQVLEPDSTQQQHLQDLEVSPKLLKIVNIIWTVSSEAYFGYLKNNHFSNVLNEKRLGQIRRKWYFNTLACVRIE